jgi:ubiquinone/menaquinone biosynthesis C-methylase UbiE
MLARILEPEVMDTASEAVDYNRMDHRHVNRVFVDDLLAAMTPLTPPVSGVWQVFDAGTGTALIPLELMTRGVRAIVTASDLAEQMLIVGRQNIQAAGFSSEIQLVRSDCKQLPNPDSTFDVVMSNSIVHHIPEPGRVLAELWRILKPGGLLFVRDLMRPANLSTLDHLVKTHAGDANAHQQQMFRDSLHAALMIDEVREHLEQLQIPKNCVAATSDRHWTISVRKQTARES